ncbi:predicted protein, partial [Haematococcus lacustris]
MEAPDESGGRLFASCLLFYEELPPALALPHTAAWGLHASKALCLLSRTPCLHSLELLLHSLHRTVF